MNTSDLIGTFEIELAKSIDEAKASALKLNTLASTLEALLVKHVEAKQHAAILLNANDKPLIDIDEMPTAKKREIELNCEIPHGFQVPQEIIQLIAGEDPKIQKSHENVARFKPWTFVKVASKDKNRVSFQWLGSKDPRYKIQKGFCAGVYDFVEAGKCYVIHSRIDGTFGSWDAVLECGTEVQAERAAKILARLYSRS